MPLASLEAHDGTPENHYAAPRATAEAAAMTFGPATWRQRAGAFLVDTIVVGLTASLAALLPWPDFPAVPRALTTVGIVLLLQGGWQASSGRTIGKYATGCLLVAADGGRPGVVDGLVMRLLIPVGTVLGASLVFLVTGRISARMIVVLAPLVFEFWSLAVSGHSFLDAWSGTKVVRRIEAPST